MRTTWKLVASLVAITALALMAATTVPAANPNAAYTCVKVKGNGQQDVRVGVPESAVAGLTNAGFTCVPNPGESEGEDPGTEDPGTEDPGTEDPGSEDPGSEDPGGEDPGSVDPGNENASDENPGDEHPGNEVPGNGDDPADISSGPAGANVEAYVPQESRSLYCSTNGPAFRANGDGMGIALNLPDTQGALLVELGLARPANFYQGVGASCDLLPGFTDSGAWVDHVGEVVPGVAVYPLFVPASTN
jgi:hypothetical protein